MKIKTGYFISDQNVANIMSSSSPLVIGAYINKTDNQYIASVTNPELPVIAVNASPIELTGTNITGTSAATILLATSETSYTFNEDEYAQLMSDPNAAVETASYPVMALSSKGIRNDSGLRFSNVFVISGSSMMSANYSQAGYFNNGEYFISIVNTMTGRSDNVSLIPKSTDQITFPMDQGTFNSYTIIFMYMIPIAIAIVAAIVLIRRRNK
jgi:hypothetical protein